ncbi:hypothetical protein AOLI_G00294930 [Acnodon oligacanthus]
MQDSRDGEQEPSADPHKPAQLLHAGLRLLFYSSLLKQGKSANSSSSSLRSLTTLSQETSLHSQPLLFLSLGHPMGAISVTAKGPPSQPASHP